MKYVPPIGGDPNDSYVDGNPITGTEGTPVSSKAWEHPMREIVSVIESGGFVPDENDLSQLSQAIQALIAANVVNLPMGQVLNGLTLSNAADTEHDITISTGAAVTLSGDLISLSASITKRFDATFAEGTNNGGFATGESLPVSGTIHIWLISKADGTTDIFANNNATSGLTPTLPTDFTIKKYIGSIITNASNNIIPFYQENDEFYLKGFVEDASGSSAVATTDLSLSVPNGVPVQPFLTCRVQAQNTSVATRQMLAKVHPDVANSTVMASTPGSWDGDNTHITTFTRTAKLHGFSVELQAAGNFSVRTLGWINERIL
tara:strand:+ start:954 stop:1910 length:957 start_codon:yes stop_codon:yes gene_type:complete